MVRLLVTLVLATGLGLAPLLAQARTIPVRTGEHADFTRIVLLDARPDWTLAKTETGFRINTGETGIDFDLRRVFDLIPKTRVRAFEAERDKGGLAITLAPDMRAEGGLQGSIFVVDVYTGAAPTGIGGLPAVPGTTLTFGKWSTTIEPPPPPPHVDPRALGRIDSLPGVGTTAAPQSVHAQSIEQALLFSIAKAAGEGSLNVRDRADLDRLRSAGLTPPPIEAVMDLPPVAPEAAATALPTVTCPQAIDALTFTPDAPPTVRDYEAAFLSVDQDRNDPGLIHLAKGYLSLGMGDEARSILWLVGDTGRPDLQTLTEAALVLSQDNAGFEPELLPPLAECSATVEIWAVAAQPGKSRRAPAYAILEALMALPTPLRDRLVARIRPGLDVHNKGDDAALISLLDNLPAQCPPEGCPDPRTASVDQMVAGLSQVDTRTLVDRADSVLLRLTNNTARIPLTAAHHLDALAYERRASPAATPMLAASIIAYARAGDHGTALRTIAGLSPETRAAPVIVRATQAVLADLAAESSDRVFLEQAMAHATMIETEASDETRDAIKARLASHGFGTPADVAAATTAGQGEPQATHPPTAEAAPTTGDGHGASPAPSAPPEAVASAQAETTVPSAPAAASMAELAPPAVQHGNAALVTTPTAITAPPAAVKAATPAALSPAAPAEVHAQPTAGTVQGDPVAGGTDALKTAATLRDESGSLLARARALTQSSEALRAEIGATLGAGPAQTGGGADPATALPSPAATAPKPTAEP